MGSSRERHEPTREHEQREDEHTQEHERGAASVMVLSIVAVVLTLTVGGLVVASVLVASQRARLAADLGSLAGASAIQDGASPVRACAVARQVADANGAATQWCSSDDANIDLRVAVGAALWPEPAVARARAGPDRSRSTGASVRGSAVLPGVGGAEELAHAVGQVARPQVLERRPVEHLAQTGAHRHPEARQVG